MRPSASERRGECFSAENLWQKHSLHNPRIERDIARNKKRIIRWGMMRQIQKNGRPGRTEPARRYLRWEYAHPSFFSDCFRVSKHRPLKLFQHKRRIKTRFLSIKVVRSRFLFIDLRANHRKIVPGNGCMVEVQKVISSRLVATTAAEPAGKDGPVQKSME